MAVVTIKHHPELTPEAAVKIFKQGFEGKYEVYTWNVTGRRQLVDLVVKKSSLVGVAVKLKQGKNRTSFDFNGYTPSSLIRLLMVLVLLGSSSLYRSVMDDVEMFIWNAPEFK